MHALKRGAGSGFVQYAHQVDDRLAAFQCGTQLDVVKQVDSNQLGHSSDLQVTVFVRVSGQDPAANTRCVEPGQQVAADETGAAKDA